MNALYERARALPLRWYHRIVRIFDDGDKA
jgi:hypothetical protein